MNTWKMLSISWKSKKNFRRYYDRQAITGRKEAGYRQAVKELK